MSEGTAVREAGLIACRRCGSHFLPNSWHHAFCSLTCQQADRGERRQAGLRARPRPSKVCEKCRATYTATKRTQRFCSKRCAEQSRIGSARPVVQLAFAVCLQCTESFLPYRSTQEFCSPACRAKATALAAKLRKTEKVCRSCGEEHPRTMFPAEAGGLLCQHCVDLRSQGLKRCGACRKIKPDNAFSRRTAGRCQSRCRDCSREDHCRRMQDPANLRRARSGRLRRSFGITADEFDALLAAQGGVCAICGDEPDGENFHVDHDHVCCPGARTCGRCIRGILCRHCNQALGFLRDSADRAAAAASYLLKHAS